VFYFHQFARIRPRESGRFVKKQTITHPQLPRIYTKIKEIEKEVPRFSQSWLLFLSEDVQNSMHQEVGQGLTAPQDRYMYENHTTTDESDKNVYMNRISLHNSKGVVEVEESWCFYTSPYTSMGDLFFPTLSQEGGD
jgi:hypothetical protein